MTQAVKQGHVCSIMTNVCAANLCISPILHIVDIQRETLFPEHLAWFCKQLFPNNQATHTLGKILEKMYAYSCTES